MSLITKPVREFNVESRAFKEISKEKPTPAPRHKSDQYDVQRLMRGGFEKNFGWVCSDVFFL